MSVHESYFNLITESLDVSDLIILNYLKEEDATAKFKSIKNTALYMESDLTEAKYRKTIARLTSIKFVELNTTNKEHALYLTEYGTTALNTMLKKVEG